MDSGHTCATSSELARAGTPAAAARRLGVEHTTVARRIQALEKQMGAPLFAREAAGHRLTEAGPPAAARGGGDGSRRVGEERAAPASRRGGPRGLVRVGVTQGFGTPSWRRTWRASRSATRTCPLTCWRCRACCTCRGARPISSSRLERPKRGSVIVSQDLPTTACTCTASASTWPAARWRPRREDLRHHDFMSYVDDLLFSKELQFIDQLWPPERFALRSTSITAQYEAVRAGAGLAVLPAFLADRDPDPGARAAARGRFTRTFWMSMPAEAKHLARMQAIWAFLR